MKPLTIVAGLVLAFTLTGAWSAGGGGDGGSGGAGGGSAYLTTDADYRTAMDAVKKEAWSQVIAPMSAFVKRHPENADAWNELGHAYRMTGDMDNSFKNYEKALQIDPKHRGAHEYLGEAYLQVGDLARAEMELKKLDALCFFPCEEYSDLKEEIRRYKAAHPVTASG